MEAMVRNALLMPGIFTYGTLDIGKLAFEPTRSTPRFGSDAVTTLYSLLEHDSAWAVEESK